MVSQYFSTEDFDLEMQTNCHRSATTLSANVLDLRSIIPQLSERHHYGQEDYSEEEVEITNYNDVDSEKIHSIRVKPKRIHQNPQTPMVLPSTHKPKNLLSWLKQKTYLKEFFAEFLGTMVMIIFGSSVLCQVICANKLQDNGFNDKMVQFNDTEVSNSLENLKLVFATGVAGSFDNIAFGWAAAVTMGYLTAGGSTISGGHLNPSITIANCVFRAFPIKKVPIYVAGQLFGAIFGCLIAFGLYKEVIVEAFTNWWDHEAVGAMFCTMPMPFLSSARQFLSELLCTAMLQACIFALTDPYTSLSTNVFPILLFILVFVINASMSLQTAASMNLARDFGPRLALTMLGFSKQILWSDYYHYFWVPIIAPILGALLGGLIYDIFIYQGNDSPVNWPHASYVNYMEKRLNKDVKDECLYTHEDGSKDRNRKTDKGRNLNVDIREVENSNLSMSNYNTK
ncbi:hypothetical protein KAFR_0L00210 [Kazachstania africana CBS 2517]|uniref:Uncharacterized protein n=1 Tax=Kazachstania africana (strain ATCC 22294 / BCRC 22015 / CBS 2517 / CECT 1963 / NBRC 1671 / NRRL Y-8276) TaxID=1071382 RepID=H2B1X8_KAZAF|nr:hypothetical protein KAFR_0L00210 [Kazachstania africana CBS 2517]CCF60628.1 hypothetical protein KAFR_0L00210 [Kazachstania africana CBS 2517]